MSRILKFPVAAVMVALAAQFVVPVSPGAAQDGSLQLTLSLDAARVWPSQTPGLRLLVEHRNMLNVPLRWHPQDWLFSQDTHRAWVCVQATDGRRYVVQGHEAGGSAPSLSGADFTEVLPAGGSSLWGWEIGSVVAVDEEWRPVVPEDQIHPEYEGVLPVGEYDIWVRFFDGPAGMQYPERMPAAGVYESQRVRLSVLAEGTPLAGGARLRQRDGKLVRLLRHRGTALASASSLSGYGIEVIPSAASLVARRGRHSVSLPCSGARGMAVRKGGPPLPAVMIGEERYLPLRYVADRLGLKLSLEAHTGFIRLEPAPSAAGRG